MNTALKTRGWSAAQTKEIRAFNFLGTLVITARGQKPTPCYEVAIHQLPIMIFPPEFAVVWRDNDSPCIDVVASYQVMRVFMLPRDVKTIRIHDASGGKDIPIEPAPFALGKGMSFLVEGGDTQQLATGMSSEWDFGEALRNAINALPAGPSTGTADELFTFEVISSGALIGGIAGFNHLYVTVRAPQGIGS